MSGEAAPGLLWVVPFAGLLLTIATAPLLAPSLWHHHYGKLALFWVASFVLPLAAVAGPQAALDALVHALLLDYLPFIVLLVALYTVTGGIRLTGTLVPTPAVNTLLLLMGTLSASVMGTTGAAMLFLRPLLRANRRRAHNRHVFVFFIFLVANIGGALTPLGDPPLFIGFMEGVPFFWPTRHLLAPSVVAAAILLGLFYLLDRHHHRKRPTEPDPVAEIERLGIEGVANLALLLAIVLVVLFGGVLLNGREVAVAGVALPLDKLVPTILLAAIALFSLGATSPLPRRRNEFGWGAMLEVAILFAAIFVTIVPALRIVAAGAAGPAAGLVAALQDGGRPNDPAYFWATGLLSAFLDNAPTYLLFFNFAGGDPAALAGPMARTLLAISAGAVFFGALTYIGNAPNLMVRAVCEGNGVPMPGFFGYMLWSFGILVPVFALLTVIFFL